MFHKKNNNKGFTLMEMLIVVAIIAILIAIAIPTFSSTLEKARESTDAANIRAAYSEAASTAVTENKEATKVVTITQSNEGWSNTDLGKTVIGTKHGESNPATLGDSALATNSVDKDDELTVKVYPDGTVEFSAVRK